MSIITDTDFGKMLCPLCGEEMIMVYEKPALNYDCPRCGFALATTAFEEIDLDETIYQIVVSKEEKPTIDHIRVVSEFSGKNFIQSREFLLSGGIIFQGVATQIKEKTANFDKNGIKYAIIPDFPY